MVRFDEEHDGEADHDHVDHKEASMHDGPWPGADRTAPGITLHRLLAPAAAILAAFLVMAALVAAPAAGQDDRIAGTWQKDHTRSDADWPQRQDRRPVNPPDVEIEISLEGEDVVLTQTSRRSDWPAPQTLR